MEALTYSLKIEEKNSREYYQTITDFTDKVLVESKSLVSQVTEFKEFVKAVELEEVRMTEEYILELLSFGVLWQTYAHVALKVKHAPLKTLSLLAEWRKKHQNIKPYIDTARGVLTTMFLLPGNAHSQQPAPPPTMDEIERVYKWFMATGEFREQALRFTRWREFWQTKSADQLAVMFRDIESFTFWFKESAVKELGKYTQNVNPFLDAAQKRYRWREDRISCTRSEVEYHLNMVGAELMNRAFKEEFDSTEKKAVLLPGCMRKLPAGECKATKVVGGLKCEGCTPGCKVDQLTEMGKKNNFEVYIIPHASDLSLWSPAKRKDSLGVVASACLTTLVEGGWELKRYGVPAQCVVLDYSGCKKHWHSTGIPTEFSIPELKNILAI